MIRILLLCAALAACGIKGDPLPVEPEHKQASVSG